MPRSARGSRYTSSRAFFCSRARRVACIHAPTSCGDISQSGGRCEAVGGRSVLALACAPVVVLFMLFPSLRWLLQAPLPLVRGTGGTSDQSRYFAIGQGRIARQRCSDASARVHIPRMLLAPG